MFNTKNRLLIIIIMLLSSILPYPTRALACSCVVPDAPQEAFVRADAVFVGTVTRAKEALVIVSARAPLTSNSNTRIRGAAGGRNDDQGPIKEDDDA